MDLLHLSYVNQSLGQTLTPQEYSNVEVGIIKRRATENLTDMKFWGKIMGEQGDYVLVVALLPSKEGMPEKKFFFCTLTSPDLQQFPVVSNEKRKTIATFRGRLSGDPSLPLGNADENTPEEEIIREIDRLACMVEEVDSYLSIIPNGSYIVLPNHSIVKNPSFNGLGEEKAMRLDNYYHFRPPKAEDKRLLLKTSSMIRIDQYYDSLAEDLQGSWTVCEDGMKEIVILQNFIYPGAWAYHKPNTSRYGYCYFGDGLKNLDLIFTI